MMKVIRKHIRSLLIYVRDISYSWSLKQYGEKLAGFDYKLKFRGFFFGYYTKISCFAVQLMVYLFLVENGNYLRSLSIPTRIFIGFAGILLLVWLIGEYLLKRIAHIPVKVIPQKEVYRKLPGFWIGFIMEWVCTVFIGIRLTTYIRSGEKI